MNIRSLQSFASWRRIAVSAAGLLGGCTAPVQPEETATSSEALYTGALDFQIGIVGVKYVGSKVYKSSEAWTGSFSSSALSSSLSTYSGWTSVLTAPTGLRVALKNLGPAAPILQDADFRIVIGMRNSANNVGPVYSYSDWASVVTGDGFCEDIASEVALRDVNGITWSPDQFMIGIEERVWPASQHLSFSHFYIGAGTTRWPPGSSALNVQFSQYIQDLAKGQVSWSFSASFDGNNLAIAAALCGY